MLSSARAEVIKKFIKKFYDRAYTLYFETKPDLNRLDSEYPSADGETLYGVILTLREMEGFFILQFASLIDDELSRASNLGKSTQKLKSIWFFDYPPAVKWYFEDNGYEKLKEYIDVLYYLRLLCLEYLEDLAKHERISSLSVNEEKAGE